MGSTSTLADYAVQAKFEDLPEEVIDKAKALVLFVLGTAIGGFPLTLSKTFLKLALDMGAGSQDATLLGSGRKVSAPFAAFGNCAFATMLDLHDMHWVGENGSGIWPGCVGVPAALAATEKIGGSGKDFLNSVVVGYEVSSRIVDSMSWSKEQRAKIWGETAAVFSSAAAAGKAFRANHDEMLSTLGIAGVYTPVSSVGKYLGPSCHPMRDVKHGWAWMSMTGVFAAESAKRGMRMTQEDNILDGANGLWLMLGADGFEEKKLTANLGVKYNILSGLTKNHSGGVMSHGAIDAINELAQENNFKPSDIERVDVMVDSVLALGSALQEPKGLVSAEFSVPYQVAASLLAGGRGGPSWYADKMLQSPEVLSLAKKVNVGFDEECTRVFLLRGDIMSKIRLHTKSGRQFDKTMTVKFLSKPDELRDRFLDLASNALGRERAKTIMRVVDELDKAKNVNSLVKQLHPI